MSDEEVREMRAVSGMIFPGSMLNISGVVTGCPCEEGPACSDQVWVVAHSAGRTQGFQLSRVSRHWQVGIVQQWWLDFDKMQALQSSSPESFADAMKDLYDRYPACINHAAGATREAIPPPAPEIPEPVVPAL